MYPYIYIGFVPVPVWAILLAAGYILALIGLIKSRPADLSLSRSRVVACAITHMLSSWIGAVILNIFLHINLYADLTYQEAMSRLGVASLGGLIAGYIALWILSRELKFSFIDFVDFGSPYLMLINAFGRIGCLFAGCCYGIETNLPWGFKFLSDGIMRHPTQAHEMAIAFGVFGASRFIYKNLRQIKGFTAFYVIFLYSLLRFFNEFLRAEGPFIVGRINYAHPFLLVLILICVFGTIRYVKIKDPRDIVYVKGIFIKSILRLFLWFACSLIFPLLIIYLANRIWS